MPVLYWTVIGCTSSLTNRHPEQRMELIVNPADLHLATVESAELLTGADAKAANSYAQPDLVRAQAFSEITIKDGKARCELPPLSFIAMTLKLKA